MIFFTIRAFILSAFVKIIIQRERFQHLRNGYNKPLIILKDYVFLHYVVSNADIKVTDIFDAYPRVILNTVPIVVVKTHEIN